MYNPVFYVSLPSRSVKFHKIFLISDLYTVLLRSETRAACTQSFALWQQATIEIMLRHLSYYCFLAPRIYIFVLRAHPVRGESHNQRNAT